MNENPGPKPDAEAEEPQLFPGGVDAIDDPKYGDTPGDPVPRDLDPEDNPAVEDKAPDEITQPDEEKQQEPDSGDSGVDAPPDEEANAQGGEGPTPEPPA